MKTTPRLDTRAPMPTARGPLSEGLTRLLSGSTGPAPTVHVDDPVADDDLQLALWLCYELHYRGLAGIDEGYEWNPDVIAFRGALECSMLGQLRREVVLPPSPAALTDRLWQLVHQASGPSLARYLQRDATVDQVAELMQHRSIYQLKEADPHTWAIPKLAGAAKAALVEIQMDEYGRGVPARMHSELFRATLRGFGLCDDYGAYVDVVPGITLAISNVISLFGMHRAHVGALVGHLASYEMTSSDPARRTARGLRRLGADDETCDFFDEHVVADALHEQLAVHDMCGSLAAQRPDLADQILFGAATSLYVDERFARHVLGAWTRTTSSLLAGTPAQPVFAPAFG